MTGPYSFLGFVVQGKSPPDICSRKFLDNLANLMWMSEDMNLVRSIDHLDTMHELVVNQPAGFFQLRRFKQQLCLHSVLQIPLFEISRINLFPDMPVNRVPTK